MEQTIKLLKKGIKLNGEYFPCWYSSAKNNINGNATITIKDYAILPAGVNKLFTITNETDSQSDYFDRDRIRIPYNHPLFNRVNELAVR